MNQAPVEFRTQVASDIIRDGFGVELVGADGAVLAEVFRSDADHTLTVSFFVKEIPLPAVELLLQRARKVLREFEDGTPVPESPGNE
jgi:hypothetical protein